MINLDEVSYMGNSRIKPAGVPVEWTLDMLEEYEKCKNDPIYFIRKYIRIVNVDRGLIPFDMYPYQEEIVKSLHNHKNTIVSIGRQSGKTTTTASYAVHQAI